MVTHNLLQLLKKAALPEEYANAHPKRLRFAVFTMMGRLVNHAGQMLVRVAWEAVKAMLVARRRIVLVGSSPG